MAPLSASELKDILEWTIILARNAGKIMLEGSQAIQIAAASEDTGINEKKNSVDLVTEYDVKVEELVKKEIREKYPSFKFVGEETAAAGNRPPLTDEPTFCVDPIDGTTNFVHAFPFACISLGLIDEKRPVLGVIYNPFLDHLYTGIKGQGSYLTRPGVPPAKLPLHPARPLASLSQALLAIEWGSDRKASVLKPKADSFTRLAADTVANGGVEGGKMAHSLRSIGSAALNFAMVAQGGLDLYWEIGCWEWDVCAGIVIAQEAGGFVTGSRWSPHDGEVTEDILRGRKYLVVRGLAGGKGESALDAQKRIVKEFYETVDDVDIDINK
ncbi:inositol monophosphatase [Stereum hirsutum FP-91666 SS1]|uniref:inositol monophosphatase n=1 Tax=Stereum hirsutum (strain FP-91666) TaxID=721885 RepID=UPI000444A1D2|nr:inositol monophosphatase [Stereum hirsutum FP-91666 SS1]EIM83255.1 inositol monophosphatase [Stereum hirsutum FP-91666 SS1]